MDFFTYGFEKRAQDLLAGGKGDGHKISEYPKDEVREGRKVEREHTKNPEMIDEIVTDHEQEDVEKGIKPPTYYKRLKKVEGGEKKAFDIRPLMNTITRSSLSQEGLAKLKSLNRGNMLGFGLLGSSAGSGIGYLSSDDSSKRKKALMGAALGGLGGTILGRGIGHIAGNRLIKGMENHRQSLLEDASKIKEFYKKDLQGWKALRSEIQDEVKNDLTSVPKSDLDPFLASQVDKASKIPLKEYSKSSLSGFLKNKNPRSSLNKELEKFDEAAAALKDLNKVRPNQSMVIFSTRPLFRVKNTAAKAGIHFGIDDAGDIATSHPQYAKAKPSDQLDANLRVFRTYKFDLFPNLKSMDTNAKNVRKAINEFFSDAEHAHQSDSHWKDFKKKHNSFFDEDDFGGRGSSFHGYSNYESHLKTLGLDKRNIKSKRDVISAWKTLAKKHHPDVGGSEDKMKEINGAMDNVRSSSWFKSLPDDMEKKSGVIKGVVSGLLGVSEFSGEQIARKAGSGVRRAIVPAGAAGGTAAIMKKNESEKEKEQEETKTAFVSGFEKSAEKGNVIDDVKDKLSPIAEHIKGKYSPLAEHVKGQAFGAGKTFKSLFDYEKANITDRR